MTPKYAILCPDGVDRLHSYWVSEVDALTEAAFHFSTCAASCPGGRHQSQEIPEDELETIDVSWE